MMENQHQYDVTIDNQSDAYAQIALQGPLAEEVLQSLTSTDVSAIKFSASKRMWRLQDIKY